MAISSLEEYKPVVAMVAVQCIYAGMALFAKAVFEQGMSPLVFVVYRQAIATLVLVPTTIITRRGCMVQGSLGWTGLFLVLAASIVGATMNQYFYYQGLHLATSSVATAMINLVPAITFVMAVCFGLEKVRVRSLRSMAKVLGTIICVGGAISMGLFKGPKLLNVELQPLTSILNSTDNKWMLGCLFLMGSNCCWSLWLILQVPICKRYLDPLTFSASICLLSTFQTAILTFYLVPDLNAWKITSILELISCLFVGIFGSGVTYYLQSWIISVRGPLFSAMFNPLCTVITTIISVPLLHEELRVGSLVGGVAVVCGLYMMLWGKAKDFDSKTEPNPEEGESTNTTDIERRHHERDMKKPLLAERLMKN